MSGEFDKLMQKNIAENPEIISCTDIPESIKVKISHYTTKTDGRGETGLYLYLDTKDGKRIVQKYTKSSYKAFYDAIQKAGGFDKLKAEFWEWCKGGLGQMKNERLLPVPLQAVDPKGKK